MPVPLTRCIQMHTPSPCWVCRLQHQLVRAGVCICRIIFLTGASNNHNDSFPFVLSSASFKGGGGTIWSIRRQACSGLPWQRHVGWGLGQPSQPTENKDGNSGRALCTQSFASHATCSLLYGHFKASTASHLMPNAPHTHKIFWDGTSPRQNKADTSGKSGVHPDPACPFCAAMHSPWELNVSCSGLL